VRLPPQVPLPVRAIPEYRLALVAPGDDVVDRPLIFDPKRTRHSQVIHQLSTDPSPMRLAPFTFTPQAVRTRLAAVMRDFREDFEEIVHGVNMLFFGRGRLAEAHRNPSAARSDLEWVVIDYHVFAITHLLDYLCLRDGGLIHARLKVYGLEHLLSPVEEVLERRVGGSTVRQLIEGFRDKLMAHPHARLTADLRAVRENATLEAAFEAELLVLLDRLHDVGGEVSRALEAQSHDV
jgi:hypothetical protein